VEEGLCTTVHGHLLEAGEVDENLSAIAESSLPEGQAREIAAGARLFDNATPEVGT
jgi:hypothetical protein